jgi:hypothetical protein
LLKDFATEAIDDQGDRLFLRNTAGKRVEQLIVGNF